MMSLARAPTLDLDGCSTDVGAARRRVIDGGTHGAYGFCRRFGLSGTTVAGPEVNHYDPAWRRSVDLNPDIAAIPVLLIQNV